MAARRGASARAATGSPSAAMATNGRSASPGFAASATKPAVAAGSRGMSNISSNRAPGPDRKLVAQRLERLARLAVDGDDQRSWRPRRRSSACRAVAALPSRSRTRAPGRAVSFSGAAAPLAKTRAPRARRPRARAGSAKSSSDLAALVEAPVREHDRDVQIDVGLAASSTMIGPNSPAALLAGVGRAGVRQIEIEAGIGRREADVGARRPAAAAAWVRPPYPALALRSASPGKLSVVGSASLLTSRSFSVSPFLSRNSGPGVAPA